RWLVERTRLLVTDTTRAYESWLTVDVIRAFDDFVEDLSNWYIRRSRRRFWDGDEAALRTLWHALVTGVRVVSPLLPFLAEHLWHELVGTVEGAPDSVFLAGWPDEQEPDRAHLDEVIVERTGKEGWAVAAGDGVTVALDTALDDELLREGRVNELVHHVNTMRKDAGLELTDRIVLTIPEGDSDLLASEEWIKAE